MAYSTQIKINGEMQYIGTITENNNLLYTTAPKDSASLVEAELNAELKRLVSLNPSARKFKPLVKETKSNNEVNDTGNNIPIPLENIGTYIPPLRITQQRSTSKQPPRRCCGRG